MSEEDFDEVVHSEMIAISDMISAAEREGLLAEVIWSALSLQQGTIHEKCMVALNEWDV